MTIVYSRKGRCDPQSDMKRLIVTRAILQWRVFVFVQKRETTRMTVVIDRYQENDRSVRSKIVIVVHEREKELSKRASGWKQGWFLKERYTAML